MQKSKLKILQNYRLRPQKKGKIPSFTRDFEKQSQNINSIIKNKVENSFQLNKFGILKFHINSKIHELRATQQRVVKTEIQEPNTSSCDHLQSSCLRFLKYNQTRISPDHRMIIRKRLNKQHKIYNSDGQLLPKAMNVDKETKENRQEYSMNRNSLPKIVLTARQKSSDPDIKQQNKQNPSTVIQTARCRNYQYLPRNKCFNVMHHIVTMGRREVGNQLVIGQKN